MEKKIFIFVIYNIYNVGFILKTQQILIINYSHLTIEELAKKK